MVASWPGGLLKANPTRTPSLSNTVMGPKAVAAGTPNEAPKSASGSDAFAAAGAGALPRPNKSCARIPTSTNLSHLIEQLMIENCGQRHVTIF